MKRKNNYIFFDDDTKERILHWFAIPNNWCFLKDFILITKDHTYWYTERRSDEDVLFDKQWISQKSYLYQLKPGVHTLDISNYNSWHKVENFNRFEIFVETEGVR